VAAVDALMVAGF
jgi:hypothetical protein